jgi:hypothetical protein
MGAREPAVEALERMRKDELGGIQAVDATELSSVGALIRTEHGRLERLYGDLLRAYRQGDWPDVIAQWAIFEPALRSHMALEEEKVFPAFREVNPAAAVALLAEHDELRTTLEALGVNIELHSVTPLDAEELVRRLRAHGAHEERILYPWLDLPGGASAKQSAA